MSIDAIPNVNELYRTLRYNFDYGDYTGLAFQTGFFYPIWSDNSNSTGNNVNGANSALDLYTAAVLVIEIPDPPPGGGGGGNGYSISLGNLSFANVPNSELLQASLILMAEDLLPGSPPSSQMLQQFEQRFAIPLAANLEQIAAAYPSSTAALIWGGRPLQPLSPQAVDQFFQAAWTDGVLTAQDLNITL